MVRRRIDGSFCRPVTVAPLIALLALALVSASCSVAESAGIRGSETSQAETNQLDSESDGESGPESDGESGPESETDSDQGSGSEANGPESGQVIPSPSLTEEELALRLAQLGGRLAVGRGPELAVMRPDGARVEILDGSETVLAAQPTWSSDGNQLAWSSVSAERQIIQVQQFADTGFRDGDPTVTDAAGNPIFYLQWNEADDRLAYIRNATTAGTVEVGMIEPGLPVTPLGGGAPFFISWSPSPDRLLGHVNESSIERYDREGDTAGAAGGVGEFTTVITSAGGFSAPVWVDDERALIVSEGQLSYLDVAAGSIEPLLALRGPIRFVLSPDRTKLAYQSLDGGDGSTLIVQPIQDDLAGLTVLDLATLEQTLVTRQGAAAWEWSPDSATLAWLETDVINQRPSGRWNFWSDVTPPATVQSQWFQLTRKYGQSYLPFFAQYAQSVTGWAPDSSAFAFAGTIDGERGVWIQLVDEVVSPKNVGPGDFVTWGRGESPPPSAGASAA